MKKSILVLSFLVSAVLSKTLTMQESIDKTLSNNPDIKSALLNIKLSQSSYDSVFADFLPQVNLQAQYNINQTYVLPAGGRFNTIDDNGFFVGVNLKQKIWDFEKTSLRVDASKIDEDISLLSAQEIKLWMVYKIKSLYKQIVVQEKAIKVRKKDLIRKKAYYDQAEALVLQGLKTKADSSRFLSAYYAAEENLALSQASYDKAKKSLSLYIGEVIPKDTEFEMNIIKKKYELQESSKIQEEVLNNNPQIKIDTQNISKNTLLYKSTLSSHYGEVNGVASYSHFDTLNSYDSSLLGVTLDIPLYSGGRTSAEAQKAQINIQVAKQKKASKILSIKEEISNLMIDIKRYEKTIKSKQSQLSSANETKNVLQGRYKEGLSTYIEVLDVESLSLESELGLLESYYTKSVLIDKIDYLKGKI
jgi:outer membrane protein TolC